jgi:outer membrane lipoprotein-sorting protein
MFRTYLRTFFLFGFAAFCIVANASAVSAADNVNQAVPEVVKAEQYLNGLRHLKARFVMTAHDGAQLSGSFYLNRPGKLRFNFDLPVKDFIVADGRFIYFYDDALGEQSNAPIGTTLADFLLRDNISLRDDITVNRVLRAAGLVQISLAQKEDPGAGQLILGFDESSFELRKWRVIDSLGNITEVALFDLERDPVFEEDLFFYRKPKQAGARYND